MTKRLVFIHGIRQGGKDPEMVAAHWKEAWSSGLARSLLGIPEDISIGFPYYGDVLEEGARNFPTNPSLASEVYREVAMAKIHDLPAVPPTLTTLLNAPLGAENWEWVQAILRVLEHVGLSHLAIAAFLREVDVYLNNPGVRNNIDRIVSEAIDDPSAVVVGHSLGSVVAFNCLRGTNTRVGRLVTIGCPLGIEAIRRRVWPLQWPGATGSWTNAYDERDVVALNPLDRQHFDVGRPIQNKNDVRNDSPNHHEAIGYLADPTVARWIHDGLMAE